MSLTSQIRYVRGLDSAATDGSGKTGLAFGDFTIKYLVMGGTLTSLTPETITTLGTYQAPSDAAHIRIKEVSNADPCKGVYEVHFHNTQVAASGVKLWLFLSAAGAAFQPLEVSLTNDANVVASNGNPIYASDLTIASATSSTVVLPTTYTNTNALPNDASHLGKVLLVVGGTGAGQIITLTSRVGSTREWNVSGMVTQLDNSSACDQIGIASSGGGSDPLAVSVPGSYGAGTVGFLIGTNLNATITSRMATYSQPSGFLAATFPTDPSSESLIIAATNSILTLIGTAGAGLTNLGDARLAHLNADVTSRMATYTQPTGFLAATFPSDLAGMAALGSAHGSGSWATATGFSTLTAGQIFDLATSGHTTSGTFGAAIVAGGTGDPLTAPVPGSYAPGTAGFILGTNLNATVGSRSTFAGGAVASVTEMVSANVVQINADTVAASNLARSANATVTGVVGAGATTTSIPASSINPAATDDTQFVGLVLKFTSDTATTGLRGQGTTITGFVQATSTFTVVVLTRAPTTGDTFVIN